MDIISANRQKEKKLPANADSIYQIPSFPVSITTVATTAATPITIPTAFSQSRRLFFRCSSSVIFTPR